MKRILFISVLNISCIFAQLYQGDGGAHDRLDKAHDRAYNMGTSCHTAGQDCLKCCKQIENEGFYGTCVHQCRMKEAGH